MKKFKIGMTLMEVVVTVALVSILLLAMSRLLSRGLFLFRVNQQNIQLQEKTARVMREFEFSVRAASEILTADSNELSFYRFYDADSVSPTKMRYFVEGTTFKVGKTLPIGLPPVVSYPPENETIDFLIEDLSDTVSLFEYFDSSSETMPLPDTANVRMIKLTISLDKNGAAPPAPLAESTKVSLRNRKTNL